MRRILCKDYEQNFGNNYLNWPKEGIFTKITVSNTITTQRINLHNSTYSKIFTIKLSTLFPLPLRISPKSSKKTHPRISYSVFSKNELKITNISYTFLMPALRRSTCLLLLLKADVLKNLAILTGKDLCWSIF